MFENFWLPCMVTVAAISLSAILFKEFLKKRVGQFTVEGSADNDSATENETVESATCTCTSPQVNEMATSSGYDYEVFLSFRGPDTRSGFTDYLYTSLTNVGIRTFRDDNELRVGKEFGPELLQAINQSKISIPIFSKNYASSAWCLKELVQMVECQKNGRQKIMPIFYDVAPLEVRHQIGGYGEAFHSHEKKKRYREETICQWKAALNVVGDLKGWDLSNKTERREGEFANKVTEEVFGELKKAYLVVSDYLVSVDKHVVVIMERLDAQTSETRIIGIHGMGGIGKTTTAKIIYNKLLENFEGCCFLPNIREMSKHKGIECLQNQLISDILKLKWTDIKTVDEGTQIIKDRLSSKRILLLLDDVHEKNHINALVGGRDWFGKGSKIIITTRNKGILDGLKVDGHYELTGMDHDQSLQLFSKHAFRRDSPLDEYISQSKRVVGIAGGLPLVLEIIGSLLSHTKKEEWDGKLKELENVPLKDVQSRLKISYKALGVREQHIFLDIACLFVGYNKDILVHFWDESIFFPKKAMDVLENMSLIKIEKYNHVWMHDQLRDLGREIVREKSQMKIEKQSRVWNPKEALHLLRKHEGETNVEALRLEFDNEGQYRFTFKDFKRLSNLRFLEVANLRGKFCAEERLLWHESPLDVLSTNDLQENLDLLPQLRWLSWHDIPPTFNITNFAMDNVVILNLSHSRITDDWKGWSHMKVMKNLKVLNMSNCLLLKRLPNSIGSLKSLRILILKSRDIRALPRLPKSLIDLQMSILCMDTFPDLSNLTNLKRMDLDFGQPHHKVISNGLGKHLMPRWLGNLSKLEFLALHSLDGTTLPTDLSPLPQLKSLRLRCPNLCRLPTLPSSLSSLNLGDCRSLCSMGDLSNLKKLSSLHISSAAIADIQGLGCLENLRDLALRSLGQVKILPDLSNLNKLTSLQVQDCDKLVEIQGQLPQCLDEFWVRSCGSLQKLPDLSSLMGKQASVLDCKKLNVETILNVAQLAPREFEFVGFEQLHILPDLSNSNELKCLRVKQCDNMVEIQGELPQSLEVLKINSCKSLRKLPNLLSSTRLREVCIYFCDDLIEIQGELPQSLEKLEIYSCKSLQKLPNLSSSTGLREVDISLCDNLDEIQGELPQSLEKLTFYNCESLQKSPYLSSSMRLREIYINGCDNLVEIQGELPQSLEELMFCSCKSLQKLPYLSSLMGLREVYIHDCDDLVEIQGKLPQSLKKLKFHSCKSLLKLSYLSSSMELRNVSICNCDNLIEIQGELPQSLKKLKFHFCKSLQKLPYLSSSMGLREVDIRNCGNLVEIQGELPQSLEELRFHSCKSLQRLPYLSSLMRLRKVDICNCDNLVEIQGELPQSLEELRFHSCKSLQGLPYLSSSMRLRKVKITHCGKLNVEAIYSLCSEMSVKFVEVDDKFDYEEDE